MLKRVSIQNFKSLKDVTLDLQKVNLLIGPNNSGKTNFLKALEFCENYLQKKNNFSSDIKYNKDWANELFLQLVFDRKNFPNSEKYEHITFIEEAPFDDEDFLLKIYSELADSPVFDPKRPANEAETDDLLFHIDRITIYKPDPNRISQPGVVGFGEETVNADTSNLVGFLDLILGKYRKTIFEKIEADLQKCIPEFDEINLEDVRSTQELKKQFGDKSFKRIGLTNSKLGATYWADELSEGTLYFLALLCIINQPNPPKLLLLEEPEKGIHPRRIEEVINFIFGLADDKGIQVIMTTHSPAVVDMFKDMPESVFIFDKDEEGATHVKNLQRDIIEPETAESKKAGFDPPQYLNGLGEAWKVGFIGGVPR